MLYKRLSKVVAQMSNKTTSRFLFAAAVVMSAFTRVAYHSSLVQVPRDTHPVDIQFTLKSPPSEKDFMTV